MGHDGSGAEGSGGHLQKMKTGLYETLERIAATIEERKAGDPQSSYVAKLMQGPEDALLKKIGEEATETVLAAKGGDRLHLVRETADLWFHSMIVLARHGLGPGDVLAEMHRREGISGLDEKAARKK
jgi:phosphoribosyl-ATP pyrophosphohydrolase